MDPNTRAAAKRTKYRILFDGRELDKDIGYIDALRKLNHAILKYGAGVKLVIQ